MLSQKIEEYIQEKQLAKKRDVCVRSWLDSAAKKASQISVVTHVLKYINGDAKGSNICVNQSSLIQSQQKYVSTSSLSKIQMDFAGNAAALDVAGLMLLEFEGIKLLEQVAQGDSSAFAPFAIDGIQLQNWMEGFSKIFETEELSSHTLAKQVYFPIAEGQYHLLAPLYASSLTHELYEHVMEAKFGVNNKEARDCKRNERYSNFVNVEFPNLAIQTFGGTKPQNRSLLNSKRGGRSYLLCNSPPMWKIIQKAPMNKYDFWINFKRRATSLFIEYRKFLKSDLNNNSQTRFESKQYRHAIIDIMLHLAIEIQTLPAGWSKESQISKEEKYWLDKEYSKNNSKEDLQNLDWTKKIAEQCALCISQCLRTKEFELGDAEYEEIKSNCLEVLKRIEA